MSMLKHILYSVTMEGLSFHSVVFEFSVITRWRSTYVIQFGFGS